MIVPVWVRREGDPTSETLQYTVLDDQSNVGFISESVCDKLNLQGPSTQLLLSTMQEKNAVVDSNRITGIEVLDYHRNHIVSLPVCYKRDSIPANRSQIPRPEVIKEWIHLKQLAEKLMPYNPDEEISLLIGNNCTRAIRPRSIIAGREDDPYGQESLLGWGVVGSVCTAERHSEDRGVCHKVNATETRFAFSSKTKEIFDPNKVLKTLERDFIDHTQRGKYSVEDDRFLKVLEKGIRKRSDARCRFLSEQTARPSCTIVSGYFCIPQGIQKC